MACMGVLLPSADCGNFEENRLIEVKQNLRMQGQYLDRETGLHYNTFRYYDADLGAFTTPDPIGLAGGLNLHRYALNPVNWIDPWGLSPCRDQAGRFRRAQTATEEMSGLPRMAGRSPGEIRKILRTRGYTMTPARSGGEVWTKSLPDGNTASVRIDPRNMRSPPHYADARPHVHKESVPSSQVTGGNYSRGASTHTDTGGASSRGSNPNHNADVHIPMRPGRPPFN